MYEVKIILNVADLTDTEKVLKVLLSNKKLESDTEGIDITHFSITKYDPEEASDE
tara:strand:- start:23 stop:187 length:165 start_codon:yes stop_codon:yes gene_type:complete